MNNAMSMPMHMGLLMCDTEKPNIITVAWTGIINTIPPKTYISVRPRRHSYNMIKESGEFVVNLTTDKLVKQTDYCGVKSGRDVDKFKETKLTRGKASELQYAPTIEESPVNIECKLERIEELGSHHMFVAKVLAVHADEKYMDEKGKFDLSKADLIVYSHGEYHSMGEKLGTFGYSIKKKDTKKK